MNRLTRAALDRPSITVLLMLFLLLGGIYAATQLNQELVPQVEFPQATVVTLWPGASADEVTKAVVEPIESALEGITDVEVVEVSASASESFAAITLRAEYGTSQDELRDAIEEELKDVDLPEDAEEPEVVLFSFSDLPVVQASVTGADGDLELGDLQRIVDREVIEELEAIDGVSSVAIAGGREEKIFIDIDPVRLTRLDQSIGAIQNALRSNDLSFPAGSLEIDGKSIPLQVTHRIQSEQDLANLSLSSGGGGPSGGQGGPPSSASGPPPAAEPAEPSATARRGRPAQPTATRQRVTRPTATEADEEPEEEAAAEPEILAVNLPVRAAILGFPTTRELTPDAIRVLENFDPNLLQQVADAVIAEVPEGGPSPVSAEVFAALPDDIQARIRRRIGDSGGVAKPTDAPTARIAAAVATRRPASATLRSTATRASARATATAVEELDGLAGLIAANPDLVASMDPEIVAGVIEAAPNLLDRIDPEVVDDLLAQVPLLLESIDPAVVSRILEQNADLVKALDPATIQGVLEAAPALLADLDPDAVDALLAQAPDFVAELDPRVIQDVLDQAPRLLDELDPAVVAQVAEAAPEVVADLDLDPDALAAMLEDLDPAALAAILDAAPAWLDELDPDAVDELSVSLLRRIPPSVRRELPSQLRRAIEDRLGESAVPAGAGGRRLLQADAAGPVRVGDVATVSRELEPAETLNRSDGEPSLSLIVFKDQSANTVEVVDAVLARMTELEEEGELEEDLSFNLVFEQATFIKDSLNGVRNEGILGGLFAILVILIFLNFSVRSTLVTAVSIPLSIVVALLLMRFQGLTLNILSLAGLTIAIGRVVDDAIVVIENIYRHIQSGQPVRQAVIDGTREVSTAITAATLVTVAVFLPLGLVGGITSEFFKPFAFTASYALLASLLVAVTIVPLLAARLMRRDNLPEDHEGFLQRAYTPILRWALDHRGLTLLAALLLFVGSLFLLRVVDKTFLPSFGEPAIQVEMSLPPGTDLATTDQVALEVESLIEDAEGIDRVETTVGRGSQFFGQFSGADGSKAFFYASILGADEAAGDDEDEAGSPPASSAFADWFAEERDAQAMAATLRDELEELGEDLADDGVIADTDDLRFTVTAGSGGGPQGSRYDLQVKSDNEADLEEANDRILEALEDEDNWTENPKFTEVPILNLSSNLSEAREVTRVEVDPARAVARGLSTIQVGLALREMVEGQELGEVELVDGDQTESLEVFARYPTGLLSSPEALAQVPIKGSQGPVPLGEVAEIRQGPGPVQVTRIDGERAVVISGEITSQDTFGVLDQADTIVAKVIADENLEEDVTVGAGAESSQQREGFRDMLIALPISILIVYLIMVLTFGSLVHPFTILFSLPFAVSGALAALAITDRAISMSSLIGMMMLIGIVTTNAIVLVDLVQQYRAQGMGADRALMEAGRHRLRPIIMTAIATIIALVPQAIGFTEGALIASELATTVIGGLLTSTVLTLVIVPVIYSLLDGLTGGDRLPPGPDGGPIPGSAAPSAPTSPAPVAVPYPEEVRPAGAVEPEGGFIMTPAGGQVARVPTSPPTSEPPPSETTPIL